MKLTYLGKQYTPSTNNIETVETDVELQYLGRSYKMRASKAAAPSKAPSAYLTYRGIPYQA